MASTRYAIYFTPPPASALARFGASVLGYDCDNRLDVAHPDLGVDPAVLQRITAEPRRYGFHATLVAPFHLNGVSEDDLAAALEGLARQSSPIFLGRLALRTMGRFVVLQPAQPAPQIEEFAAGCVQAFNPYRAPLSEKDRMRRLASGLTPRQAALLGRWGYPYVFEEFRFHMTLAGPVRPEEASFFMTKLSDHFGAHFGGNVAIDAVSLVRQDDSARFHVRKRVPLTGR